MFQHVLATSLLQLENLVFATGNGWSLDNFFSNSLKAVQQYGGWILMIVGAGALIWSIVNFFRKYIFQDQNVRIGPVMMIVGAVFGAAFMIGGWNLANTIGQGLNKTANDFGGNGSALIYALGQYLPFK